MMKSNLEDIRSTLQAIRSEKYPGVPSSVIDAIFSLQVDFREDPVKRKKDTIDKIIYYANSIKNEEGD